VVLSHYPTILCEESRLLVLWCAGDRCGMSDSDGDHGRSRRPGAEDRGWSSIGWVLSGRMMGRSGDTEHKETRSTGFLVEPQNQGRRFLLVWPHNWSLGFPGLGLKIDSYNLVIWALKSPQWFLGLGLRTKRNMVSRLCYKTGGRTKTAQDARRDLAACFA
jgi:hypothetical protein